MTTVPEKRFSGGDTKKDRKGRPIYFKGYSDEVSKKGVSIELWGPEI
jgi:hypothetical protein